MTALLFKSNVFIVSKRISEVVISYHKATKKQSGDISYKQTSLSFGVTVAPVSVALVFEPFFLFQIPYISHFFLF